MEKEKQKYSNIKKILKRHIDNGENTLWTWDKKDMNFTCLYNTYEEKLKIYTVRQLLETLENE
tara:strand:+ start:266 stop:454 length:189 start_codon:yes stop_codon:yes gene_type:complete